MGKLYLKEDINNYGSDTKTKEPEVNEGYVYDENKQFNSSLSLTLSARQTKGERR